MAEIGKVSVRVMPDTRGFATKARRDIKALKDVTFKVNAELNEKQFGAKVKQLIAKTNADLMDPKNRIKFRASLEASNHQLASEVRDIRNRMQDLADKEKVKFETELSRRSGKGDGNLLKLDPKGAVRELKRELGGTRYELPVYANTSGAMRDIRRMSRSREFKIDVDLKVDRTEVHKDIDTIKELIDTSYESIRRIPALKFQIDTDKASVEKWTKSVKEVEDSLKRQRKIYRDTQRELQITKDRAADYGNVVSEATKTVTKLKAQQKADLEREEQLTQELLEVRRTIASAAGDVTDEALREKRLVGQIEDMRRQAFQRSAERAEAEAKAMEEIRDASREIQKLEQKRAQLKADGIAAGGQIERLEVDQRKLQADLDRARNKLEMDSIELDVRLDQASLEAAGARLAVLARDRVTTIWTRIQGANMRRLERQWGNISRHAQTAGATVTKWIGQLAGVRVLWRTFRDMVDWLPRLDMMVPQIAQNFSLITAAASGAVGALGTVFTLLSDIGEVGKLALALPAVGLGAVGSGLIVGRAIYDFKEVFPEIVGYWERLGEIVSSRVWRQAAGPVRDLHSALTPILDANVPDWATAWGDSMAALTEGLRSPEALGHLERFLENSIAGTENATRGWESLGSAIMRMAGVGSDVFPDLGTWFSETMADFDSWTQRNSGNIERWIREGMTALSELGSIAVSTVKIIAGVADAFEQAGWPGLTELESGMRSLGDAALTLSDNSAFMQTLEQIRDLFSEIGTLGPQFEQSMGTLWTMLGASAEVMATPITNALSEIMDGFNSAKFQNGFGKFITGIASFVQDVAPGLGAMTAEIGSLLGVVGTAAKSWGPAFNEMLLLFANAGDNLHPGLTDFVENLGPRLHELVLSITPAVEDFATALGDLLGSEGFQDLIGDLIGDLGSLGNIILDVGKWVAETATSFSDWYGNLGETQQALLRWGAILTGLGGGAMLFFANALIKIGGALSSLSKAIEFLKLDKAFDKAFKWFKGTKYGGMVTGFIKNIGRAFKAIPRAIGALVTDIPRALANRIGKGGLLKGIGRVLVRAVPVVGLLMIVRDIFNNIKPVAIMEWVEGVLRALGLDRIADIVDELQGHVTDIFGADVGLIDLASPVFNALRKAWDGLKEGWNDGGVWGAIKGAVSGFVDGFFDGLQFLWESIKTVITHGSQWLQDMVANWQPTTLPGQLTKLIIDRLPGLLGLDEQGNWSWGTLTSNWKDFAGEAWDSIKTWLDHQMTRIADSFMAWEPQSLPGSLFKTITLAIPGLLGFDENGSWSWDTLTSSWKSFAEDVWNQVSTWLDEQIDEIARKFNEWEPKTTAGSIFKTLTLVIPGLLGFGEDGSWSFDNLTSNWKSFASEVWDSVKTWLDEEMDNLWTRISEWEPIQETLDILETIADWVVQLFGFDDFDHAWDEITTGFEDITEEIEECLETSWEVLKEAVLGWNPVTSSGGGTAGEQLGEWVAELFGLDEGWAWDCDNLGDFWDTAWSGLESWLQEKWDELIEFIREWNPYSIGFKFGEWLGNLIDDLFSGGSGTVAPEDDSTSWWDDVKAWAQEKWDALIEGILAWVPETPSFQFGVWLGNLVGDLLSGGGGIEEEDDSTSWWDDVKAWAQTKWDELVQDIKDWVPNTPAFQFGVWLGNLVGDLLSGGGGIEEEDSTSWWEDVKSWAQTKWDELIADIKAWVPNTPAFRFGAWLGGLVRDLLSGGSDEDVPDDGTSWWDSVKGWFQAKWDELVEDIKAWVPETPAFKFGEWLGKKVREWLGLDGEGGGIEWPDFEFDFSSLWEEKLKPALETALKALAALILAPGLAIIAPIALGALVVKWLFGDGEDDEGEGLQGAIEDLKERIGELYEPIKEALTEGIEELGRLIGGIVHDVICLPQYVFDEIFTDCFGEEGMYERVSERVGRWGNPIIMATRDAVGGIADRLREAVGNGEGAPEQAPGNGLIDRLLGISSGHVTGTLGNLARLGAGIGTWSAGVGAEFKGMGGVGRREITGLTDLTEAEFGSMRSSTSGDARSMNSTVVGQFISMAARGIAQAVRLQSRAVAAMARANSGIVAQGRAANAGFVGQMNSMSSRSLGVVGRLSGTLPARLRMNTSGSGNYTGSTFVSGLSSGLSRAVGVARSMAGRIRSVLSFSVRSSGATVGSSFASGLRSRIGAVGSAASALARAARSRMPNSPADEGPFSGRGWGGWGESIAEELAKGLRKSAPEVAREAERLMGGVHSALDARSGATVGIDFERTRRRYGLAADEDPNAAGTTVNVNVESRSEDPLRDGNRFGGDIAFALRGAGLA